MGGGALRDTIIGSLALLDERGGDERISIAMAIVREAFSASVNGEDVGCHELLQRARWADSSETRDAAGGEF